MEEELAGVVAAQEEVVSNDTQVEENQVEGSPETTEADKADEKTGNPKIDDPWPSSARNKVNRLNKQLAKERAELEHYRKQLQQQEAAQQKSKPESREPNEDDFDNYGDYLKALATFRPDANVDKNLDPQKIQQEAFQKAQQEFYYNQRVGAVTEQTQKALQELPQLLNMVEEYSDVFDIYPPEIEMAFLQADNAPMAFYALATEGKLEQLAYMTPVQAAHEIAKAQIRGEQMAKAAKVTKAPTPIKGASGASQTGKSLSEMSYDELRKNLNF